jgi:hypothetical protein
MVSTVRRRTLIAAPVAAGVGAVPLVSTAIG